MPFGDRLRKAKDKVAGGLTHAMQKKTKCSVDLQLIKMKVNSEKNVNL